MDFILTSSTVVAAPPDEVFHVVMAIDRLPDWNREIPMVVEALAELTVGSEWVVSIRAMKTHWDSRSRVLELDPDRHLFVYRSQSDDGNPSFSDWRWQLARDPGGRRVTVDVAVNPRTFLRRMFLSELRRSGGSGRRSNALEALSDARPLHCDLRARLSGETLRRIGCVVVDHERRQTGRKYARHAETRASTWQSCDWTSSGQRIAVADCLADVANRTKSSIAPACNSQRDGGDGDREDRSCRETVEPAGLLRGVGLEPVREGVSDEHVAQPEVRTARGAQS